MATMRATKMRPAVRAFYTAVGLRDVRLATACAGQMWPDDVALLAPFVRTVAAREPHAGQQLQTVCDDYQRSRYVTAALAEPVRVLTPDLLRDVAVALRTTESPRDSEIPAALAAADSGRLPLQVDWLHELTDPEARGLGDGLGRSLYQADWDVWEYRVECYVLSFATLPIGIYAIRIAEQCVSGAGIYILPDFRQHWGFGEYLREQLFAALHARGMREMQITGIRPEAGPQHFHERLVGRSGVSVIRYQELASRFQVDTAEYPYIWRVSVDLDRYHAAPPPAAPAEWRKFLSRVLSHRARGLPK